ncbi:hypothetical protein GSI_15058 [Ganoderma sinense ZZ0214-1]|uniref:Uncharacterized protein n=1 Tax=Ganoderma sinense ZZ0214-1 TaxID=1077348 RepID=A0A2G8RLI3_9APHY|nr:hypothetical protein GSI_15058 [Ganoderma sinense ZZ0214-1]
MGLEVEVEAAIMEAASEEWVWVFEDDDDGREDSGGGQMSVGRRATLDDELAVYDGDERGRWRQGDGCSRTGLDAREEPAGVKTHEAEPLFWKVYKTAWRETMNTVVWEPVRLGWEVRHPRECQVVAKGARLETWTRRKEATRARQRQSVLRFRIAENGGCIPGGTTSLEARM